MTQFCGWIMLLAALPAVAEGEVIVLHSPSQWGASASDTDYAHDGSAYSGRLADDFTVDTPAIVRHVTWWGDYGWAGAPPASETVRIRFYDARPSDGLPGDSLFENSGSNPVRALTGAIVHGIVPGTAATAPEYEFGVDLAVPFSLDAGSTYWLEIAQIGDRSSRFEWEYSGTRPDSFAYAYPSDAQWQSGSWGNLAFELSRVPEPATLTLTVMGVSLMVRGTGRHRG
jgi:hypothetical protein